MPDAQWLDQDAAAARLGLSVPKFLRRVKAGALPAPSAALGARTLRWSVAALDAAMAGAAASGATTHRQRVSDAVATILAEGRSRRAQVARRCQPPVPGAPTAARGTDATSARRGKG